MRRTIAIVAAGTLVLVAAATPVAQATYPGKRGSLVFDRLLDPRAEDSSQVFRLGSPLAPLTNFEGGGYGPDFSADGTRLAVERRFGDGRAESVTIMDADGSSRVSMPTTCSGDCLGDAEPAWDPSGTKMLVTRAYGPIVGDNAARLDLVEVNLDGSGERVLRHFESGASAKGREPHTPQFSPDGRRIVLNILNTTTKPRRTSRIYVLDADGTDLYAITPRRLDGGEPDWSPDGKRIVFSSSFQSNRHTHSDIYTVRPDGTGLRRIRRESRNTFSFDPVWSPDGGRIAFVRATPSQTPHIWTMRANGTRLRKETLGKPVDLSPEWGVRP
jgi:Tol biopolymer transport system component